MFTEKHTQFINTQLVPKILQIYPLWPIIMNSFVLTEAAIR